MLQRPDPATRHLRRPLGTLGAATTLVLISTAALLAHAATAAASPPQPFTASGSLLYVNDTYDRNAGPNMIQRIDDAAVSSSGTVTGTYLGGGHQTIFGNGTAVDQFRFVFTGSTPCGPGSFTMSGTGRITADDVETGHFTTADASSNTAGIHVDIDFVRVGSDFTFTGAYHCI
jgi:hypothetical protein